MDTEYTTPAYTEPEPQEEQDAARVDSAQTAKKVKKKKASMEDLEVMEPLKNVKLPKKYLKALQYAVIARDMSASDIIIAALDGDKKFTRFLSRAAEDYAEANGIRME
jgi:hypothetical protein